LKKKKRKKEEQGIRDEFAFKLGLSSVFRRGGKKEKKKGLKRKFNP